ncbi:MAG: YggS family pyridoxal phosphate-dependent enzyme [Candidatus Omnitrophota bacterium]
MISYSIKQNAERILEKLPVGVELVAAGKTRTPEELREAVAGGVRIIGENYVQEAMKAFSLIGHAVKWHFIGHLQKNKVKKAVEIFDMIETVDSVDLAREIDKRSREAGVVMPVLIEVNSGREGQKSGVFPEKARALAETLSAFTGIKVMGLMTMGPFLDKAEESRSYFAETKKTFELIKSAGITGVEMRYLSMGMTASYSVAISEGANMVRIGTKIFGER